MFGWVRWVHGVVVTGCVALPGCAESECWYGAFNYRDGATIDDDDAFADYADECIIVTGNLKITGGVTDLSGLEGIVGIHGSLRLVGDTLGDTDGLSGLEYVVGDVVIAHSDSLDSVQLPRLRSVAGTLKFEELPRLNDLSGMPELVDVHKRVVFSRLDAVRRLDLPGFRTIGALVIEDNAHLEEIIASDTLFEIGGDLRVRGNPVLQRVQGFGGLDRVGGLFRIGANRLSSYRKHHTTADLNPGPPPGTIRDVLIDRNDKLEEVVGFGALHRMAGEFDILLRSRASITITHNAVLARVDAFENVDGISNAGLWLYYVVSHNPEIVEIPRIAIRAVPEDHLFVELNVEDNLVLSSLLDLGGIAVDNATIRSNPALESLEGLTIKRGLRLLSNDALTSIEGLSWVGPQDLRIEIASNSALRSLAPLFGIDKDVTSIRILNNPELPQSEAAFLTLALNPEVPSLSKVAGNEGWVPMNPCAYVDDRECDELPGYAYAICQPGTDEADCAE